MSFDAKPKVAIVIGHTRENPGAWGVAPLSCSEYQYNIDFAQAIMAIVGKAYNIQAFFRDGMTIKETYQHIEVFDPDVSIELHFNSCSNPLIFGTETLCCSWNEGFASLIQENLCLALNRDKDGDRGVKVVHQEEDRGFESVRHLRAANVLIEPFFGSSPEDCALALENQESMARAILAAIDLHLLHPSVSRQRGQQPP